MPKEYLTTVETARQRVRRNRSEDDAPTTETKDDRKRDTELDPGAYVGRRPERQAETIPGGISDADERVAAHSTQPGPRADDRHPEGHREGPPATDDTVREAGQDR